MDNPIFLVINYQSSFDNYCKTYFQLSSMAIDLEDGLSVDYDAMAELVDELTTAKSKCLNYKKLLGGEDKLLSLHSDYSYQGIDILDGKLQSQNVVHIANRLVQLYRDFNFYEYELGTLVKYLLMKSKTSPC